MALLRIERRRGAVGIPASAELDDADLPEDERIALDRLFSEPGPLPPAPGADRFQYLITRVIDGTETTLEVPEHLVPQSIARAVRARLPGV